MLSEIEKKILGLVQNGMFICERPFRKLAEKIGGISEAEAIDILKSLNFRGYIRKIGPIFDSGALGYKSALAAIFVEDKRIGAAAELINSYQGVTHNYYRRDDRYNIWFTLTAESDAEIIKILENIKKELNLKDYLYLPSEKTYKIKAVFQL